MAMTMAAMAVAVEDRAVGKLFLIVYALMLNSCVALAQEDLKFMDFTVATERPDFVLKDMKSGEMFDSKDHDDAAFVIEFYFNSCPACNTNARNVKRLANEYAGNDKVQVIEVSIDCDERQYQTWINNHDPLGPVLNGCNAPLVRSLAVQRFPTTYVFSPNKREAMRGIGVWSTSTYGRIKRFLDQVAK